MASGAVFPADGNDAVHMAVPPFLRVIESIAGVFYHIFPVRAMAVFQGNVMDLSVPLAFWGGWCYTAQETRKEVSLWKGGWPCWP